MGNQFVRCCVPSKGVEDEYCSSATNLVELAASELFSFPGLATAYHTSVIVNSEEFFFSDSGIFTDRTLASHQSNLSERLELGYSTRTGRSLLRDLDQYFRPGTYDLIHKNCNSFTDCAIYYLLRKRLERKYCTLERFGQSANAELLNRITKGMYQPNPQAAKFRVEDVLSAVDALPADSGPAPGADGSQDQSRNPPALGRGSRVTVVGMKNAVGLNGYGATIVRYNAVNGRWEAMLDMTGEVKAFRAENLRPAGELVLEPGDVCRIHGLKSEAGRSLNGMECEVVRYVHERSRYEVLLGSESKAVKAENLARASSR